MKILVTGANGQLGRLVIQELSRLPGIEVFAGVRRPDSAAELPVESSQIRVIDYDNPTALRSGMAGIDRLLLISSSEVGRRVEQHRNVIEAAQESSVERIVYTSVLHAPTNRMMLAGEHLATEELLSRSGMLFTLLRNGWYTENYLAALPQAIAMGSLYSCAGEGKLSLASRADYAAAAAKAITASERANQVYELAGDTAYTMSDIAAEFSRQSGKAVQFVNLSEADYCAALQRAGFADVYAKIIADSDAQAACGALHDESRQLSDIIGRPTTTLAASVCAAISQPLHVP